MYSYNVAGRVTGQQMSVLATTGPYYLSPWIQFSAAYQWDNEGRMTQMQNPSVTLQSTPGYSIPTGTLGYQYDINGRMNAMTWGSYSYASASYEVAGEMLSLTYATSLGGSLTETRSYNNMLQLTHQAVPGYLDMTYNYTAMANNGRISSSVDAVTGESTSYSYDSLNRLSLASNSLWSAAYSYDGFGNLKAKTGTGGAPAMTATYDANNHQAGGSFDANGNVGGGNYSVENRLLYAGSGQVYGYDPSGKRVMTQAAAGGSGANNYQFSFYGMTGQRLVTVGCTNVGSTLPDCSVIGQNVYFKGKLLVSNGVTVVTDRLGSVRGNVQGERMSYYPYGEERTGTVDGREKFGTYFRDGTGLDYADQRNYDLAKGRFTGVDPAGGIGNRYAYVGGDPVNFADPRGADLMSVACGSFGVWVPWSEGWDQYVFDYCKTVFYKDPFDGTNPEPGASGSGDLEPDSNFIAASRVAVDAMDAITHSTLNRPECQQDLAKLGVTADQIHSVTKALGVSDGTTSKSLVSIVGNQQPDFPGETVQQLFINYPNSTTFAGNSENTIFIRPDSWVQKTAADAFGTVLHEALHFLGLYDGDIGAKLFGDRGTVSSLFSSKLKEDCYK